MGFSQEQRFRVIESKVEELRLGNEKGNAPAPRASAPKAKPDPRIDVMWQEVAALREALTDILGTIQDIQSALKYKVDKRTRSRGG